MSSTPTALKIGYFGGAFDPPHVGHLQVARSAIEALNLDCLHWVPTGYPSHKARQLSAAAHRLAMSHLAVASLSPAIASHIKVDDGEIRHYAQTQQPSYTFERLLALKRSYPTAANAQGASLETFLIVGQDQAVTLHTWHRAVELASLVKVRYYPRSNHSNPNLSSPNTAVLELKSNAVLASFDCAPLPLQALHDVSSTQLRELLAKFKSMNSPDVIDIDYLQTLSPAPVIDYALAQQVY